MVCILSSSSGSVFECEDKEDMAPDYFFKEHLGGDPFITKIVLIQDMGSWSLTVPLLGEEILGTLALSG